MSTAAPAKGGWGTTAVKQTQQVAPAPAPAKESPIEVEEGVAVGPRRVLIYGSGGIGKTSLVEHLKRVGIDPLVIDLDRGSAHLNVARIPKTGAPGLTYDQVRSILQNKSVWEKYGAICIDSFTRAEELAAQWVIKNVPHENPGTRINRIEDYGWGKGYSHIYDAINCLLSDLDGVIAAGKHVILIAHDCTANVPNPAGLDFIRYEPRLQSPASGKNSVRHRVKEWLHDMFFVGYDVYANKEGKASGAGTRTIYPQEMPTHWAKSRALEEPIAYEKGSPELWEKLFDKEAK